MIDQAVRHAERAGGTPALAFAFLRGMLLGHFSIVSFPCTETAEELDAVRLRRVGRAKHRRDRSRVRT